MFFVAQLIDFCYGHRLLHYAGKCRFLHGHNGRAEIILKGVDLDERGMLIDFTDVKQAVKCWIDEELDHRMILHQDDPLRPTLEAHQQPLVILPVNPTAENIARLIYDRARDLGMPVEKVRLWETRHSSAIYQPR